MTSLKKTALWTTLVAIGLKLSGLVRESIIAKEFGASAETTGYYLAFSFITLVIAMIATGFNNVFLPMYIQDRREDLDVSNRNANGLLNITVILFITISIIGYYGSPWFVSLIYPNMSYNVELITTHMTKLFFAFMTIIALSALLDSYLQSHRIFVPSQISKLLATLIAAFFALFFSDVWGIYAVAYGFVLGTGLGVIIQIFFLIKSDYKWKPTFKVESDFRKAFLILLVPALLNSAVGQVNLLVNRSFAAGIFDEAVTYLNNASMIISIPNAIYATTFVTIIFTLMSEQISDQKAFKDTFFFGMEISLIILLPIAIGLFFVGDSVISFIYERGKFTAEDTYNTYMALLWYVPTIIFQSMQLILSKSMYARGKTSLVFRISATTIVINFLLNWILVEKYGYLALAFSASIVSIYYFTISMIVVYKDLGLIEFKRFISMAFQVIIPTTIMGFFVWGVKSLLLQRDLYPLIELLILAFIGVFVYVICLRILYPAGFVRIARFLKKTK